MKRVIVKELPGSANSLLSYGKSLHLLKPTNKNANFESFNLEHSHTFENPIRFTLDTQRDALVVIDDTSKALRAYELSDYLKGEESKEIKLKA